MLCLCSLGRCLPGRWIPDAPPCSQPIAWLWHRTPQKQVILDINLQQKAHWRVWRHMSCHGASMFLRPCVRAYALAHQVPSASFEASPCSATSYSSTSIQLARLGRRSTNFTRLNQRLGADGATQSPRPTPSSWPFRDPNRPVWAMTEALQSTISAHPGSTHFVESASRA